MSGSVCQPASTASGSVPAGTHPLEYGEGAHHSTTRAAQLPS